MRPKATNIIISLATEDHAEAISALLHQSIRQLCVKDHRNDPDTLAEWLQNKSENDVRTWIHDPKLWVYVARQTTQLAGVSMISLLGNIKLCYVHPEALRLGVGRLLMKQMETDAKGEGLSELTLESTRNARAFYDALGYQSENAMDCRGQLSCLKMKKLL